MGRRVPPTQQARHGLLLRFLLWEDVIRRGPRGCSPTGLVRLRVKPTRATRRIPLNRAVHHTGRPPRTPFDHPCRSHNLRWDSAPRPRRATPLPTAGANAFHRTSSRPPGTRLPGVERLLLSRLVATRLPVRLAAILIRGLRCLTRADGSRRKSVRLVLAKRFSLSVVLPLLIGPRRHQAYPGPSPTRRR